MPHPKKYQQLETITQTLDLMQSEIFSRAPKGFATIVFTFGVCVCVCVCPAAQTFGSLPLSVAGPAQPLVTARTASFSASMVPTPPDYPCRLQHLF